MIFLGNDDVGGRFNSTTQAAGFEDINYLSLSNCVVDCFFVTSADVNIDPDVYPSIPDPSSWDINTIINAQFNGNLDGGNLDFNIDDLELFKIKRSEKDSLIWKTIGTQTITTSEDLNFLFTDYLARGEQDYDYALVPYFKDGTEGNYNISSVKSEFHGAWFMGRDPEDTSKYIAYNVIMDVGFQLSANQVTSTVNTLGRRYPYVNKYGLTRYDSGTITGCFIALNSVDCTWDIDGGVRYREKVEDFLLDGLPKVLKFEDGRIWLVMIVDAITKDDGDYYKAPTYAINFVEVGRFDSERDLYNNGLLDINPQFITEV